jgi:hypothetical protein
MPPVPGAFFIALAFEKHLGYDSCAVFVLLFVP